MLGILGREGALGGLVGGQARAYGCFEHGVVGLEAAGALLPPVPIAGQGGDVPSHALAPLRDEKPAHKLALTFLLASKYVQR